MSQTREAEMSNTRAKRNSRFWARLKSMPAFTLCYVVSTICLGAMLHGCASAPRLTDLAKSPVHPVQQEQRYPLLNKYQQDALYFSSVLQETHPEPYRFITKEQLDAETGRLVQLFAHETSDVNFRIELRKLASRMRDSHTQVSAGNLPDTRTYPLGLVWMKEKLCIAAVAEGGDTSLIGSFVLGLNNVRLSDALQRIAEYYSYDNFGWVRWKLIPALLSPYMLRRAGLLSSDTLLVTVDNGQGVTQTIPFMPVTAPKLRYTHVPTPVSGRSTSPYSYTILPSDSLCYFQWNSMMDKHVLSMFGFFQRIPLYFYAMFKGIGYFDDFLDDMFEEMHEKGVRTLVVDLRGNTGGSSTLGTQLLYKLGINKALRTFSTSVRVSPLLREMHPDWAESYERRYKERTHGSSLPNALIAADSLRGADSTEADYFSEVTNPKSDYYTEPPAYPFCGKVFFISGEGTFSSGSILVALVKDNNLFTVVGQPTGQASHYGELLMLRLPKTDTYCQISCKRFTRPDASRVSETAISPDVEIWPTFAEFHQGKDTVIEWIINQTKTAK
jgi:hypothetical protein